MTIISGTEFFSLAIFPMQFKIAGNFVFFCDNTLSHFITKSYEYATAKQLPLYVKKNGDRYISICLGENTVSSNLNCAGILVGDMVKMTMDTMGTIW